MAVPNATLTVGIAVGSRIKGAAKACLAWKWVSDASTVPAILAPAPVASPTEFICG